MKKENINQATILYLNVLLATNFIVACVDEMEGTPLYRHTLKKRAKAFVKELTAITEDDMNKIWGIDDPTMYEIMSSQEELFKIMARSRPETSMILVKMCEKFNQAPDAIINWLGLQDKLRK